MIRWILIAVSYWVTCCECHKFQLIYKMCGVCFDLFHQEAPIPLKVHVPGVGFVAA